MKGVLGPDSEDIDRGGPIANILVIEYLAALRIIDPALVSRPSQPNPNPHLDPDWKVDIPILVQVNPCRTSEDLQLRLGSGLG